MEQLLAFQAIAFAAQKHRCQRRKDGQTPYINHPIQVLTLLAEVAQVRSDEILAAAVLHDILEDTDTTAAELAAHFGPVVTGMVAEVTDDPHLSGLLRKQRQIETAPRLSAGAALIRLADKAANVNDLLEAPPKAWRLERRQAYVLWAEQVVDRCPSVNPALELHAGQVIARVKGALGLHDQLGLCLRKG
jgi:GTP diphosphokinase / guanosine-3',5'-bis(diphosphate) 3'-diphosphatase